MKLTGRAFKFWQDLKEKPKTWLEFKNKLNGRFGGAPVERTNLLLQLLSRKQTFNEKTKSFCIELFKLGERAEMDEKMIIQAIISNLLPEKKIFYKLHINNDFTYKKLMSLVDIIEEDKNEEKEFEFREEKLDTISELTEKINQMSMMLQQKPNTYKYVNTPPYCRNCNKQGHSLQECRKKGNKNYYNKGSNQNKNTFDNYAMPKENNHNTDNQIKYDNNDNDNDKKFKRINFLEKLLKFNINDMKIQQFKNLIFKEYPELKNLYEIYPENFYAKKT
ncbi:hypothetical protein COBT_003730, partial [Conglomerata obtusa]